MKPNQTVKLILTAWIVGMLAAHVLAAEKHTLKSSDGRTIEAEITQVTETHAQIVVGKKSMKVELKKFSEETQAMLKEWKENNVSYGFELGKSPKVVARPGGEGDVHHYGYELLIQNRQHTSVPPVTVKYQIYNTAAEMHSGEFELLGMDALDKVTKLTVAGSRTKFKRHWEWNGSWVRTGSIGNHLGGIWIRFYDKEGAMVHEWKSLNSKVRKPVWTMGE